MNLSLGTDCILLSRIEKAMQNPLFIKKILSQEEQKNVLDVKYVAGRWAAKEAVYKALSQFNIYILSLKKIAVLNNEKGAPYIVIDPSVNLENIKISVSISHEKTLAIATAIAWKYL